MSRRSIDDIPEEARRTIEHLVDSYEERCQSTKFIITAKAEQIYKNFDPVLSKEGNIIGVKSKLDNGKIIDIEEAHKLLEIEDKSKNK